jgi:peptidoglycan/LPS O-acetylase OafA/YrhL
MSMSQLYQPASEPFHEPGRARAQLGALTGLRFVAALGVVLYHYQAAFMWWNPVTGVPAARDPQTTVWARLAAGGALGVDCFFILSGFILAYTYVAPGGGLRGSRATFWVARLARIYPVYLVGLALDALPFVWRPHHLAGVLTGALAQPSLLQAWVPSLGGWNTWNPPGWSLSVEAFFYLLFPFLLVGLARRSRRALWAVAGASWGLFAAFPAILPYLVALWHRSELSWGLDQILYYSPIVRLPEFTLGMALGLLYCRSGEWLWPRPIRVTREYAWDLVLLALAAAIVGLLLVPLPGRYPVSALVAPAFAAVIILLAYERGVIARLLSRRACIWLGEVSYGIYILHVPLWAWLAWVAWAGFHLSPAAPVLVPIYLASVLFAAGLSRRFVERPARTAIRARWASWEARHEATVSRVSEHAATSAVR